jgi:hypothetical protein
MAFWDRRLFDFDDTLNLDIFARSASIQRTQVGMPVVVGAEQAMLSSSPLPWIPDVVGKNWRSVDAITGGGF